MELNAEEFIGESMETIIYLFGSIRRRFRKSDERISLIGNKMKLLIYPTYFSRRTNLPSKQKLSIYI